MKRRDSLRCAVALLGWAYFPLTFAQSTPGITVAVRQYARSDGVVQYMYRINNQSRQSVVALLLGHDYRHAVSELTAYPIGWQEGRLLTGLVSPPGWQPQVITTEESRYAEIEWRNDGAGDVQPGKQRDGFGVLLAAPSPIYTTAHWTAILSDGTTAGGPLLVDTMPRLSGALDGAVQTSPGQWQIRLVMTNHGGMADQVQLTRMVLRTLSGAGSATLDSPAMPIALGQIGAGEARIVTLKLSLPSSVRRLSVTQGGTVRVGERNAQFSTSQQFIVK